MPGLVAPATATVHPSQLMPASQNTWTLHGAERKAFLPWVRLGRWNRGLFALYDVLLYRCSHRIFLCGQKEK